MASSFNLLNECFIMLFCIIAIAISDFRDQQNDIIDRIILRSRQVVSFEAKITARIEFPNDETPSGYTWKAHCWKDRSKLRTDHNAPSMLDTNKSLRHVICLGCESADLLFEYSTPTTPIHKTVHKLAKHDNASDQSLFLIDVTRLAFDVNGPAGHCRNRNLNEYFYNDKVKYEKTDNTSFNNVMCSRIIFQEEFVINTIHIDSSNDTIFHFLTESKDGTYKSEIISDYSSGLSRKYGVPTSYRITRIDNGKIVEQHDAVVDIVSINSNINPIVFKLIGLDLPEGTRVVGKTLPDASVICSYGELIPESKYSFQSQVAAAQAEEDSRPREMWLRVAMIAGGVAVLALGIWFFVRRSRR